VSQPSYPDLDLKELRNQGKQRKTRVKQNKMERTEKEKLLLGAHRSLVEASKRNRELRNMSCEIRSRKYI
jgi:hypothetical protein